MKRKKAIQNKNKRKINKTNQPGGDSDKNKKDNEEKCTETDASNEFLGNITPSVSAIKSFSRVNHLLLGHLNALLIKGITCFLFVAIQRKLELHKECDSGNSFFCFFG